MIDSVACSTIPRQPLLEMTERDWRIFREDFDIRVKGGKAPLPLRFWEEGNLPSSVMEAIRDMGYEKPSPIQRQARDLLWNKYRAVATCVSFVLHAAV